MLAAAHPGLLALGAHHPVVSAPPGTLPHPHPTSFPGLPTSIDVENRLKLWTEQEMQNRASLENRLHGTFFGTYFIRSNSILGI